MEREEALRRRDHYRCRLCGQISPITETYCTKPACRAQLSLYGDLITEEEPRNPAGEPADEAGTAFGGYATAEKPAKKKEVPEKKPQTGRLFMPKKALLFMLDIMFFLVYFAMAYCADEEHEMSNVLMCAGIELAITVLAVCLALTGKHILHGIVCIVNGFVSFTAAGMTLQERAEYSVFMFLAMMAVFWWLGIISFLGTSQKSKAKAAAGIVPGFLKKKTVMISLDMIVFVICPALFFVRDELRIMLYAWYYMDPAYYYMDPAEPLILCGLQLAITIVSVVLTCNERYVLRGCILCVIGVVGFFLAMSHADWAPLLMTEALPATLLLWVGVLSFLKGK